MYWLEVSVRSDREAAEAVSATFAEYVYNNGVAIDEDVTPAADGDGFAYNLDQPVLVKGYIAVDDQAGEKVERLRCALDHLSFLRPVELLTVRRVAEEDWANAWKEHYHVLRLSRRLVVVPTWREYEPLADDLVLRLDPGMAFGTGLHPTTRMCMQRLEDLIEPGMSVLDVGAGSAILSLAAARLGAAQVLGVDIDPLAVEAAQANVALNRLGNVIAIELGSVPLARPAQYHVVVANIIARVIAELAVPLARTMHAGSLLIASGIIVEREQMVLDSLTKADLKLAQRDVDGDWLALTWIKE